MSAHGVDVADLLLEFLEVAVHHLIFLRQLYPPSIFVLKKMYGVPVQISRHPGLNNYITEALKSIHALACRKHLRSVSVCFLNKHGQPIDRFVFDILGMETDYKLSHNESDSYLIQLEENLRAFCLRIATVDLKPLDGGCTFQINVVTTEQGSQSLNHDPAFETFPWVELEPQEIDLDSPSVVPICTIRANFLTLQMYREAVSM